MGIEHIDFQEWLRLTDVLQCELGNARSEMWYHGELTDAGADFFRTCGFALVAELGEMAQEVGWKPWATSRRVNRDALIKETVDLLHFAANILWMVDATGAEVSMAYDNKHVENLRRSREGYDGVSSKCPSCGRDTTAMKADGWKSCLCSHPIQ